MKSIIGSINKEYIINKSKFISYIYHINSTDEVDKHLKEVKELHPFATHIVYAYIIDEATKSSDNGEPAGTAGIPTLEVLLKKELTHILAITVRYFGGIKLGAGGLVRAYSKSVVNALEDAQFSTREHLLDLILNYSYNDENAVKSLNNFIVSKDITYTDKVYMVFTIKEADFSQIKNSLLKCSEPYQLDIVKEYYDFI